MPSMAGPGKAGTRFPRSATFPRWRRIAPILLKIWILGDSGDDLRCFVEFWFCREIYGKKSE